MKRTIFCCIVVYCALIQNYVGSDLTGKSASTGTDDISNIHEPKGHVKENSVPENDQASLRSSIEKSNEAIKDAVTSNGRTDLPHMEHERHNKPSRKGHILFFHNAGTRSHLIAMTALAEGLVDHGHKVTSLFYAKSNIMHENYTEILIEDK